MLTALELYGFKSFPDRTRFEFPPGITVVVGPNGSGKSNVVDAIKWVLGEQSAKSLRGKEMADVIFKGTSGSDGRKPSNTAEATIFLDNSSRRLRLDADELRITRRVYRSGEGEYLINGDPCRLKDIRNLVRGTGFGTDAYSLIEQGKVDQLLQASPKERRGIFEEAAGISRFKAKKVEAERRLARVEQNLVRLADIVEEVGNGYRRVKSQAAKAAKYKEATERLQSLRTFVGAKDWRDFTQHLENVSGEKTQLVEAVDQRQTQLDELEKQSTQLDAQLSQWSSETVKLQQNLNDRVQQLTEQRSNIALHQSRAEDFNEQSRQQRQSLQRTGSRLTQVQSQYDQAAQLLEQSRETCRDAQQQLVQTDSQLKGLQEKADSLRQECHIERAQHTELSTAIAELGKVISANNSQLEMAQQTRHRLETAGRELGQAIQQQQSALAQHESAQKKLEDEAAHKDSVLGRSRAELKQTIEQQDVARKQLAERRRAHAGATQRADVIQDLENKLEGVGSGVKQLLAQAQSGSGQSRGEIIGLVADLIKVNVQHAELVDLALGDYAQCLVVDGTQLIHQLATGQLKLAGRVRVIQLANPPSLGTASHIDLHDQPGIVGRLDTLVQVQPQFESFVRHLLGGTWLVKTMSDAIRLREGTGRAVRFISLQGDVLEADGTMVVGPRAAVTGIVSRRSELRALNREIHRLADEIEKDSQGIEQITHKAQQLESTVETLLGEHTDIAGRLSDERAMAKSAKQQLAQLEEQKRGTDLELEQIGETIQKLDTQLSADRQAVAGNESQLNQLADSIGRREQSIQQIESEQTEIQQRQTSLKVKLAKAEQQLADAEVNHRQMQEQLDDGQATIKSTRSSLAHMLWQRRSSMREIAESMAQLASLEKDKAQLDSQLLQLNQQRTETDSQRRELSRQVSRLRDEIRNGKDSIHELDLKEKQLSLERQQLAERLRDDYDIDITQLDQQSEQIDEDREAIDEEISQLRRAIANIGSVNMDALAELEEMQQRYESLDAQYQDLVNSKAALEKIIQKINNDSRRLFAETLVAIRENFQKLFRQTFGGGRADLVLEEDVDILEAGIDIMATPPGKPEFNNSLLSGGERALTAVSLLMAIFQFRPSPFCVLDEVDAPFDEANIGRFIEVLKSFLSWTKFVIVTHSKITMTAATTLYGVTMQESGVSKRVSVRFEDVSDDGYISKEAVDRQSGDNNQRTVA